MTVTVKASFFFSIFLKQIYLPVRTWAAHHIRSNFKMFKAHHKLFSLLSCVFSQVASAIMCMSGYPDKVLYRKL